MASAIGQIEAAIRHGDLPQWADLTDEQRRQLTGKAEAPYVPMAQENLPIADTGVEGHAQFHTEAPYDPLASDVG